LSSIASVLAKPQVAPPREQLGRTSFRLIPKLETDPRVVSFSQTVPGKLTLLAIFGLTLSLLDDGWQMWTTLALLSCIAFLPKLRRLLLTLGAMLFANLFSFEHSTLTRLLPENVQFSRTSDLLWIVLPFLLTTVALMWVAAKYSRSLIARRPLLTLLGILGLLAAVASYAPLSGFPRYAIWAFLLTFCSYLWYLAYALSDCATVHEPKNVLSQYAALRPFWGFGGPPLPKGWTYWRRIEAKTPEELAVTMIKGVKLMVWCFLLSTLNTYYLAFVHNRLGIPSPANCVNAWRLGKPQALAVNWLVWPSDLLEQLLKISVWGHMIIATCRMAGFRALRNTYAPLSSRTIAEYWNRYYYYFKELLVDMFFYPTFIRCFKRHPKVRIFFATFVAASLGNTLYHFLLHPLTALTFGLLTAVLTSRNYLFYSLLLALGISISQVRSRKPLGSRGWLREHITAPACVLAFYCLVRVFEFSSPTVGVRYLTFLFSGR